MREAIGTSYVVNFIITFFILFILVFLATLSYTKAFKVKNKIVDVIEEYEGDVVDTSSQLKSEPQSDINSKLGQIGYRVSDKKTCKKNGRYEGNAFKGENVVKEISKNDTSNYHYCIYQIDTGKGKYYGVVTYIYFDIPIVGSTVEIPVYGETKTFTEIKY